MCPANWDCSNQESEGGYRRFSPLREDYGEDGVTRALGRPREGLGRAISLNADGMVWGDVPASDVRQLVPFTGVQGRAALLH